MKMLLFVLSLFGSFAACAAFEDGEKLLIEGEVPPHTVGAYRPFLLPGVITEADGVTEYRLGHGLKVWYPPTLPAAKVAELKRFMALPMKPIDSCHVAYVGDERGRAVLDSLGVAFHRFDHRNYWLVNQCEVVMVGPGVKSILKQPKQMESFVKSALSRYLVVLPGCDLDLIPRYAISSAPVAADPAMAKLPDLPVFLGAKRDFVDFLAKSAGVKYPALTGGPVWISSSVPAYFTHLKYRDNSILFMNVAPGDAPAEARDALTRFWCTVFANLNVCTR